MLKTLTLEQKDCRNDANEEDKAHAKNENGDLVASCAESTLSDVLLPTHSIHHREVRRAGHRDGIHIFGFTLLGWICILQGWW